MADFHPLYLFIYFFFVKIVQILLYDSKLCIFGLWIKEDNLGCQFGFCHYFPVFYRPNNLWILPYSASFAL